MNSTETAIARDILAHIAGLVQVAETVVSIIGTWGWHNQAPPPPNGQLRTDSLDWATAKFLWVAAKQLNGTDASPALSAINVGDQVRLNQVNDSTRWALYNVTSKPLLVSGDYQIGGTYINGGALAPANGASATVTHLIPPPTGPANTPPAFGIGSPIDVDTSPGEGIVLYFDHHAYDSPPGAPFMITINVTQLNTNRMSG